MFVPRAEYDALKQKYDVLLASTSGYAPGQSGPIANLPSASGSGSLSTPLAGTRKRKARQSKLSQSVGPEGEDLQNLADMEDKAQLMDVGQSGRKKRSMRLEVSSPYPLSCLVP
jgi:hypothetical protein